MLRFSSLTQFVNLVHHHLVVDFMRYWHYQDYFDCFDWGLDFDYFVAVRFVVVTLVLLIVKFAYLMAMSQMLICQHQYLVRMFVEVLTLLEFIYEVVIRPFAVLVRLVEQVERVASVVMAAMVAMVIKAEQVIMEPFIAHFLPVVIKSFYFMIIILFASFVFISFFNLSQLIHQCALIFSIALIQSFYFINFYLLISFIISSIIQVFIKLWVPDILAFDSILYLS